MKFFAFIFAFYILSISTMPCNDVHDGMKNTVSTFTQAQDHHQSDNDICSPFCICSCCQGFFALSSLAELGKVVSPVVSIVSFYKEEFLSTASASIWQPPRLG